MMTGLAIFDVNTIFLMNARAALTECPLDGVERGLALMFGQSGSLATEDEIKLLLGFGIGSCGGLRAAQAARAAERAKPEQHFGNGRGPVIFQSANVAAVSLAGDRIKPAGKRFVVLDYGANADNRSAQFNPAADLPTLSERANALVIATFLNIVFVCAGQSPVLLNEVRGSAQALQLAERPWTRCLWQVPSDGYAIEFLTFWSVVSTTKHATSVVVSR